MNTNTFTELPNSWTEVKAILKSYPLTDYEIFYDCGTPATIDSPYVTKFKGASEESTLSFMNCTPDVYMEIEPLLYIED